MDTNWRSTQGASGVVGDETSLTIDLCTESTKMVEDETSLTIDLCTESTKMVEDETSPDPQDEVSNSHQIQQKNENIPKAGMKFDSEEKLYGYFQEYAYQIGFGTRKISTRKEGDTQYYSLGCARGGVYVPSTTRIRRVSSKTNCKAKINVIVYGSGKCIISGAFLEHNHDLSPKKSRFQRSYKKMDSYTKRRLELNDYAGIPLNKNFYSLVVEAKGYENLSFGEKDCRNFIAKVRQLRLGVGDAEALRDYFVRMQRRSPNFFYVIDMDDEGRLRNVFWADARSRAAYASFGDVVSFDSTYLTNKYSMPFAPFVGVNHHGQSILLGCALISRETIETYVWLFNSWLECMNNCPPNAIITDQCRSMQAAVAKVFPEAHHRLCLWHIMKIISEKLGGLSHYKVVKKTLKALVYESLDSDEFDVRWSNMIKEYNLKNNEWLCSLFKDRKRWVPVYVKVFFWTGMSTTQRSESMNAFFDGYVNSKTSLRHFVEQYDNALKSKIEKETKADFESLNSSYRLMTGFDFEKQFHKAYTNAIFKLFQDELRGMLFCNYSLFKTDGTLSIFHVTDLVERKHIELKRKVVYKVSYNEVGCDIQCSCHLFEFRGIVCRHMVKVLIEKDVKEIHSRYILSRWRKDVKHSHYFVTNCYDDLQSGEKSKQFDHLCANFYEAAHVANSLEKYEYLINCINMAKERLNDYSIWCASNNVNLISNEVQLVSDSTKMLLPPLQVRSKGLPPTKRKESKIEKLTKKKGKTNDKIQIGSCTIDAPYSTNSEHGSSSMNDNPHKFSFDLNK